MVIELLSTLSNTGGLWLLLAFSFSALVSAIISGMFWYNKNDNTKTRMMKMGAIFAIVIALQYGLIMLDPQFLNQDTFLGFDNLASSSMCEVKQ